MIETGEAEGAALDAMIDIVSPVPTEDAIAIARETVAKAQEKVDKQKAHLENAEKSLANARVALAALEGA